LEGEEMEKGRGDLEGKWLERLEAQPELKARVVRLLECVENEGGEVMRASEVEERTHKEIKELGREVMRGWAGRLAEGASNRAERAGAVRYKKRCYWHSSLGEVEVEEVRYRDRRGRQQ
jgi:hypothetical protein